MTIYAENYVEENMLHKIQELGQSDVNLSRLWENTKSMVANILIQ